MNDVAIRIEDLSKLYKIGASKQRHDTLRDQLADSLKALFNRNGSSGMGTDAHFCNDRQDVLWALKGVSLEIKQGDIVGIIGRNGAGKSTLLKVLSRITQPTTGRVEIYGRIGSLLEVGTGFHPELTGRENILLNGAILGMKRVEIRRKFDEIVDFAEIEKFIDTPVKRYSSGMYVRLAFAVAAHLDPEIMIVDEVLAVGDVAFQAKCLGKMSEVSRSGRTILFVSHNMGAIARLCTRAVWLKEGRVEISGAVGAVIAEYLRSDVDERSEASFSEDLERAPGSEYVRLRAVRIRNDQGQVSNSLDLCLPFGIEMEYRILRPTANLRLGLRIVSQDGTVILSTRDLDNGKEDQVRKAGDYVSRCTIPGDFLEYGQYFVSFGADFPMLRSHFALDHLLAFRIEPTGGAGGHVADGRSGILRVRLPWVIENIS